MPLSLNRSFLKIDDGNTDAASLRISQIQCMARYEKQVYAKLDFTRCDNGFIRDDIGINSTIILNIPI